VTLLSLRRTNVKAQLTTFHININIKDNQDKGFETILLAIVHYFYFEYKDFLSKHNMMAIALEM
jgi:predicted ABC-type sugar transport system permease subunit